MKDKTTPAAIEKIYERKILRMAPHPPKYKEETHKKVPAKETSVRDNLKNSSSFPKYQYSRRVAPLPPSAYLTEQHLLRMMIKNDCNFNNSTNFTTELPQVYRNLRPAPPPPVSLKSKIEKNNIVPEKNFERKPRRKSIMDLFKVMKKKKGNN